MWRVGTAAPFTLALRQEPGWVNGDGEVEILCPGIFAFWAASHQNRPKGVIKNRRAIDLPRLMADPQLRMNFQNTIAAKLASPIPGTNGGSVDDMTSLLTETLLSNAADIALPIRRKQVPRGWCAIEEVKAELNARWQDREDARKRVRFAPNDLGLRRAFKATTKQLKRTRAELYRGSSTITLANSKGVSEKVINLASTNTSR